VARDRLALGWIALGLALAAGACSIGNIRHDDCTGNEQCAAAFGAGSVCETGFCTDPSAPSGCQKTGGDGRSCFSCTPKVTGDFHNACTDATCSPFDDQKRDTKLTADGGLPPLPP
jgi:hypothetical protein